MLFGAFTVSQKTAKIESIYNKKEELLVINLSSRTDLGVLELF